MKLVRGAWRLLVGIKDALVLILLLIFFGALYAALSARPGQKAIADGALLLRLDGAIVEQPSDQDAFASLSGRDVGHQFRLRDVVRAIDAARTDKRVKAIVLDLDSFGGGYPAVIAEVADALKRARDGGKPVLAYATAYTDAGYRLAASASEIWVHPMGGTLFMGPGGSQLYYKGLIDKLGVTAHVYRVGKYKSFVEPYTRADQSPEARDAEGALLGSVFAQWKEGVHRARPKAQVDGFIAAPDKAVLATGGDVAQANLRAGLVDRLGDRTAFGERVAQLAGHARTKVAGGFDTIRYADWAAANPLPTGGDAVGVLTVAGDIVDGKAGAGSAGGDTLSKAMLDGLATKKLKALVVRVDSPGGSALASEQIRLAVLEAKKRGLPVVVSMGGLAASGGYWVATAGDTIFAEPNTITGSIGIFGIIPTFERTLAKAGITSDGVKTTPLSGQPDIVGGTNPVLDAVLQAGIDNGYRQFVARVAAARHLSPQRVDEIAQGRVWDGGTARQIGLVDRFGTLSDAIAEAARRAKLDPAKVHAVYLEKQPDWWSKLLASWDDDDDDTTAAPAGDAFAQAAAAQRQLLARALGDVKRLASTGSIQARCLECGGLGPITPAPGDATLLDLVLKKDWLVILLRAAHPDDAAAIAAIYAPHVLVGSASFETEPPDTRAMRTRMAAADGLYPWLVATNGDDEGGVLAFAYASAYGQRPAYRWAVETTVYVADAAQRQGAGRLVYEALIDTLRAQGFTQAVGRIALPNEGSIALHEAVGFRRAGVFREIGWKHGRWIDVGVWQCELAEPKTPPAEPKRFADVGLVRA